MGSSPLPCGFFHEFACSSHPKAKSYFTSEGQDSSWPKTRSHHQRQARTKWSSQTSNWPRSAHIRLPLSWLSLMTSDIVSRPTPPARGTPAHCRHLHRACHHRIRPLQQGTIREQSATKQAKQVSHDCLQGGLLDHQPRESRVICAPSAGRTLVTYSTIVEDNHQLLFTAQSKFETPMVNKKNRYKTKVFLSNRITRIFWRI